MDEENIICDEVFDEIKRAVQNFQTPENFSKAVRILLKTKGKVIFSGIGKSGHIGKKMSATMASLGKASFFVHLSEILHGDFGMISKGDCLVLISVSGQAEEFKYIFPYCRKNQIPLISIVKNKNSILALNSLPLFIEYEKDIMDENEIPAPIISSILTIMVGDALAVAISKMKNFSVLDYKKLHPAGKIGFITKEIREVAVPLRNLIEFKKETCFEDIAMKYFNKKDRKNFFYFIESNEILIFDIDLFTKKGGKLNNKLKLFPNASKKIIKVNSSELIKDLMKKFKNIDFDYFAVCENNKIIGFIKNFIND